MAEFVVNPFYELIIDDLINRKFSVTDTFFTVVEIDLLRTNLLIKQASINFKKAAVGPLSNEQIVEEVRGDFILWMDESSADQIEKMYFSKINNFIHYINRTCYLGIQEGEFHYACYPAGTFYKRHLDVFHTDTRRTLSVVLYLNIPDWQPDYGGALALFLTDTEGREKKELVHALPGRLVIFDSKEIEHEVQMVYKPRYSITGWLKTR